MHRSVVFGQALVLALVCAFAESCLHGLFILLLTVIAIEDCNRTLAYPLFRGHFGGLLGGLLATYLLGPDYIKKHVVSPFAGDNSCYNHLPPLTEVLVDSPPLGFLKRNWILPEYTPGKDHVTSLQADIIRQARLLHGAGAEAMVCGNSEGEAGQELRRLVA